jgi:alpha-amylase
MNNPNRHPTFSRVATVLCAAVLTLFLAAPRLMAQAGFDDDRVMLEGFYWESYRFGHTDQFPNYGDKRWYEIVQGKVADIQAAGFDLVWLPPPAYSGDLSAGYNPKQYFRFDNSYGSVDQHRAVLQALLTSGIEPVADIVINHRDGTTSWADFTMPAWGPWSICHDDEAFLNVASGITTVPVDQRGACEEQTDYRPGGTYAYPSFRDIAHTDARVRIDIERFLLSLESLGYRGWRFDMVHGYHARWIALYNRITNPTFSVGEYDWDKHSQQRGWIWATSVTPNAQGADHLRASSNVFDFTTQSSLKSINSGNYAALYGFGNGIGMVADTTDGFPWKNRAVTFVENHDTGYRTNDDGTPQDGHQFDSFANNWQVEQAYAQVLTHPGVPCVYWKHYFEWGQDLQNKIRALIVARKAAGITSGSGIDFQENAKNAGVYAARVTGKNGDLYVRIGGSDQQWQPSSSGYTDYREYATGAGWKVWVKLAGNPPIGKLSKHPALPIPVFRPPDQIQPPPE